MQSLILFHMKGLLAMLQNLTFLNAPTFIVLVLLLIIIVAEIVRGTTTIWGFVAPKLFGIKTKLQERKELDQMILGCQECIHKISETQDAIVEQQNIDRSNSIKYDNRIREDMKSLHDEIKNVTSAVINIQISNLRSRILNFATDLTDGKKFTREAFDEILADYKEYEDTIEANGLTNERVNISHSIILDFYKRYELNHEFLEDKGE